jgi:hypothetical protein
VWDARKKKRIGEMVGWPRNGVRRLVLHHPARYIGAPLPQLPASNTAQGPPLALSGQRKSTEIDEFAPFPQKLAFTL